MIIVENRLGVLGLLILLMCWCTLGFAQQPQSISGGLFVRTAAVANNTGTPFPSECGFFHVDPIILSQASKFSPPITRIVGFPLGSKSVNLNVAQFDALTHDATILAATSRGDVVVHMPEYALLRGDVEGMPGSHVYLAVFAQMTLGYISTTNTDGTTTRYIVQPVGSGESAGTNVCYAEYAIDRSNDKAQMWKCGTDELAANFNRLDAIAQDIVTPHRTITPQEAQTNSVRLLKVDIECDQQYFKDFSGDTTKALSYALATLAASSDIYVRDLNAALVAEHLRVWTTPDPYITPDTSIETMLDTWRSTNDLLPDNRAGAILLSGWRGIGGLAFLATICSESGGNEDNGYCVCGTDDDASYPHDGFIWDVDVVSHEFGHIVGAPHTHSCFWAPPIDSCYPAEGNCFPGTNPVLGTIMSYCHLTPKGVVLKFHERQIPKMQTWIHDAACATLEQFPHASAGGDAYVCGTDSAVVNGSGTSGTEPYSYSWRVIKVNKIVSVVPTFKIRPITTTTYVLTLTDANNLRTYDTMTVHIGKLKAAVGGNLTVCGAGPIVLTGSSSGGAGISTKDYRYQWTNQKGVVVGTDSMVTVSVDTTGTYSFMVTDSVGCSSSTDLIITVAPKPVCTISSGNSTTFCENDSVQIDAGSGFKTYQWLKDGSAISAKTQKLWIKSAGDYACVITNTGLGCVDTSNVLSFTQHSAPTKPSISQVGNNVVCPSSAEYVSYQWYKNNTLIPGATDSIYNANGNGKYYVVVTGGAGCTSKSNILSITLSVEDPTVDNRIRLYPNPASNELMFEWKNIVGATKLSLSITDALGKTVYLAKPALIGTSNTFTIDLHSLAQGSYFLHYDLGLGAGILKFVKQ